MRTRGRCLRSPKPHGAIAEAMPVPEGSKPGLAQINHSPEFRRSWIHRNRYAGVGQVVPLKSAGADGDRNGAILRFYTRNGLPLGYTPSEHRQSG